MPTNANYEVPNQEESIIDGIAINPQGALSGQALVYDNFTNSFIPGSASGNVNGTFIVGQIPYAVGTQSLTTPSGSGISNFVWNDAYGRLGIGTSSPSFELHTIGDGYFTKRLIINDSSSSVSPSGTGAIRYNSGSGHLEFSENGGSWSQLGSTSIAIGASVTSSTSKSVLFVDGSNQLAQDNSNFAWDFTNHRLGIGTSSPSATFHIIQPVATTGAPVGVKFAGGAHTTLSAGTEITDVYLDLARTVQLTGGSFTTQRAVLITAPTYAFTSPSTITTAATLTVQNAPSSGANATFTNSYSIWAQAGIAAFDSHIKVDGYIIDLSGGASSNQVLTYDGTKFVASSAATQGGSTTATHVPYASGTNTLADSAMSWDNTNKVLTITTITGNDGIQVTDGTRTIAMGPIATGTQLGTTSNHNLTFFTNNSAAQVILSTGGQLGIGAVPSYTLHAAGDGYATSRFILAASSAAVSPSSTGAFRFNTATSHIEFSEAGGGWQQIASAASGNMAIGNSVTSGTSKSVLYIDGSSNLAQDNTNFAWDFTNHRLGIGNNSPSVTLDVTGSVHISTVNTSGSIPFVNSSTNLAQDNAKLFWDDSNFYLGLGTNAPDHGLDVRSAHSASAVVRVQNTSTSGYSVVDHYDSGGTNRLSVGYGNSAVATTAAQSIAYTYINGANWGFFSAQNSAASSVVSINTFGNTVYSPIASTTGSPNIFTVTGPAHTTLTASTEAIDVYYNLNRTVQFSSGGITTQRAFVITAPTYAFNGPSTIANAATFTVTAAPTAGTNATITNAYSMWAQAGIARFDGHIKVDGYTIDMSGGATSTQVLAYNGTSFVPTNAAAGSISGSIATNQVAYGSGTNAIQGSANLTYNGTTLTVAQHISVDGYTIDLSAGATNGQAIVYNSGSGKFTAATVSGGGGGGFGTTGQKVYTHIPAAFNANNGTTTPLTVGAAAFNPSNYVITATTQSVEFRAVAACGNGTVTGHVKLRDVTNGVDITTFNVTGTSDTIYTQTLTISSAGANTIANSAVIYEVRIYVDNPLQGTDFIQLYSSELRNINTIN